MEKKFLLKTSPTLLFIILGFILYSLDGLAQQKTDTLVADPGKTITERDGQHDFDFEIGTWKTHLKRLQHPLSGSNSWVEYEGTTVVRKVWDGRANLVELDVSGPAGRIEGLSLRLFNPVSGQWSLNLPESMTGL